MLLELKLTHGERSGQSKSFKGAPSKTTHEEQVRVFEPEDFADIPPFHAVVVKNGKYAVAEIVKWWEDLPASH